MRLPSIRQLQYLQAVVSLRHFGRAAERCHVTQSTLSTGIQELEALLGVQLLERSKRKVLPTELGLAMAEKAEQLLALAAEMVEEVQQDRPVLSGVLRLGVIPTIGPFLLPKVLPQIRQRYPQLQLYLLEAESAVLVSKLEEGELDCAIMALPYELGRMESMTFASEAFWVALPRGHRLAKGGAISAAKLPEDELLLLEEGHCLRDHALAACHRADLQQKAAFQGTSLYTLIEMVAGGQGVTFLPDMAVNSSLMQHKNIELRPLAETGPHRDLGLVWRRAYHRQKDLQLLGACFAELVV